MCDHLQVVFQQKLNVVDLEVSIPTYGFPIGLDCILSHRRSLINYLYSTPYYNGLRLYRRGLPNLKSLQVICLLYEFHI